MNNYENGIVKQFETLLQEGKLNKAELSATMFLDAIKQDFNAKIGVWESMAKDLAKAKADAFWKGTLNQGHKYDVGDWVNVEDYGLMKVEELREFAEGLGYIVGTESGAHLAVLESDL